MRSLGEQTWFPSGARTLAGWVHGPDDGPIVGAVVIAGPFAHEALVSYRALRVLAVEAARRGLVVVRFDWSGTGDSEPAPDGVVLATAWQEDLASAADLARAASGLDRVDAIGVRFGAAVLAATPSPFRRRVLWAPIGGRAFIRMQSALLRMHLPHGFELSGYGVELCNYTLEPDEAASLRALPDPSLDSGAGESAPILIDDDPLEISALFDHEPYSARVPLASLTRLIDALDTVPPTAASNWEPRRELVTRDPLSGRQLRHTFVGVGPDDLPGIFTEPVDGAEGSLSALFLPFSNDPKGGTRAGRATSVRLAANGIPTLRADRRLIGDASDPRDLSEVPEFTETGLDDVVHFATWLRERTGRPVAGIGLCSGGWFLARAATVVPFERIVMVNNLSWNTAMRYYVRLRRVLRAATTAPPRTMNEFDAQQQRGWTQRLKRLVRSRAPYFIRHRVYRLFNRDEIVETLLRPVPRETSIRMLFGTHGDRRQWESARGPTAVRRLERDGRRITVDLDPRTDHALMSESGFESYLDLLDREFELAPSVTALDPGVA